MKYLLLALVLAGACKPSAQRPVAPMNGNRFYQLGVVEGTKHAKERSQTSLVVFPAQSTNWSLQAQEEYRSGYLKGLSTTP
jgi:hypothetical protein